jgi:CheY-like chemotaxis protein
MILEECGCVENIRIVQSGMEALAYLERSESGSQDEDYPSPDLLFLDINMPAMDGWEFLEEYKKMNIRTRIIVVMLTTSLFPEDKLKAESIPEISGYENKPLTIEKVNAVLNKYFGNVAAR